MLCERPMNHSRTEAHSRFCLRYLHADAWSCMQIQLLCTSMSMYENHVIDIHDIKWWLSVDPNCGSYTRATSAYMFHYQYRQQKQSRALRKLTRNRIGSQDEQMTWTQVARHIYHLHRLAGPTLLQPTAKLKQRSHRSAIYELRISSCSDINASMHTVLVPPQTHRMCARRFRCRIGVTCCSNFGKWEGHLLIEDGPADGKATNESPKKVVNLNAKEFPQKTRFNFCRCTRWITGVAVVANCAFT